jgi:hypothetical protein
MMMISFIGGEAQIITIDDYPYEGINFNQRSKYAVPPDAALGDIGNTF